MKTYSWKAIRFIEENVAKTRKGIQAELLEFGCLSEGIELEQTRRGLGLFMGRDPQDKTTGRPDRYSRWEIVGPDKFNPPEILGGETKTEWVLGQGDVTTTSPRKILDCKVKSFRPRNKKTGKPGREFFTFAADSGGSSLDDGAVLVCVSTALRRERNAEGFAKVIEGNPEFVVEARGQRLTKNSRWREYLVIMRPGDVIRVVPEGRGADEIYELFFEGDELVTRRESEWRFKRPAPAFPEPAPAPEPEPAPKPESEPLPPGVETVMIRKRSSDLSAPAVVEAATEPAPAPAPEPESAPIFPHLEKGKKFRCPKCGGTASLPGSQRKNRKLGRKAEISCPSCGIKGIAG